MSGTDGFVDDFGRTWIWSLEIEEWIRVPNQTLDESERQLGELLLGVGRLKDFGNE